MTNTYSASFASRLGLAALLTMSGLAVHGQNLNYAASGATNVTGSYTDLGTNGTAIATANNDDANSTAQNIGFTFNYNGQAFTQFVLNTNGYLKLGSTAPAAPYYYSDAQQTIGGPLNSATEANLIFPFNTDLEAGSTGTEYRVYTSGTTGSRVCTIQWKNVSDKTLTISKQYANISFQVKLYEGTNQIEFVYNTATAATGTATYRTVAVGLKGSGNDAFQLLTVQKASTGAWSSAIIQNTDYGYPATGYAPTGHNVRSTILPDVGRTYRFTTSTACPTPTPVVSTFPYTENFNGAETGRLPCGIQVLDINTDSYTWNTLNVSTTTTVDNALVYQYNPYSLTTAANEWAFTPGLTLRAGYRYQLQFKYASGGGASYPEGLEVKYGTAATVAGQTGLIFSNANITNTAFTTTTAGTTTGANQVLSITPTTTGTYYIGFHANSAANEFALLVDDIQVTESLVLAVRNATNDVFKAEASPIPFGETLNLSFNTQKAGPMQITLNDALGRTVSRTTTATLPVGSSLVTVPGVSNLRAGIYFLNVEQGGATQVIRVTHQ